MEINRILIVKDGKVFTSRLWGDMDKVVDPYTPQVGDALFAEAWIVFDQDVEHNMVLPVSLVAYIMPGGFKVRWGNTAQSVHMIQDIRGQKIVDESVARRYYPMLTDIRFMN